jgi:hypothetical protein
VATGALAVRGALAPWTDPAVPPVPWRDPHDVEPTDLAAYIGSLERAVQENPDSPAAWTCLGMAHAVNFDVTSSMQALETATEVAPDNFWARLKYAELHYRLRALDRAEEETKKAVNLAENPVQLMLARRQLKDIREIHYRRVPTTSPSTIGRALFLVGLVVVAVLVLWR